MSEFVKVDERLGKALRVVKSSDYKPGCAVRIVMNEERGAAVAYIAPDEPEPSYNVGEEYLDAHGA